MNSSYSHRRSIVLIVISIMAVMLAMAAVTQASHAASTSNLSAAKAKYGISDDRVITASSTSAIKTALSDAGGQATSSNRMIVYVPAGSYSVDVLKVPSNVLLVGESGTKITANTKRNSLVNVAGAMYGGTYDGANKAQCVIYLEKVAFSGQNGIVENAVVSRGAKEGIIAMYKGCRNSQVIGCTTKNCKENGICIQGDAQMKLIHNCKTYSNRYSGINISHANVGTISSCTIKNNGDKAVSTNSDPVKGYNQPGCTINAIKNCKISGNKTNGVYIKPRCKLKSFTGNKLTNNKDGLVASGKTAAGTKGKSIIKNVKNNTFKGNKNSQICSGDKGAVIYIGAGNKIQGGKDSGIYIKDQGVVRITGKNNLITGNKQAGISLANKARLYITGANTKITKNGKQGIYAKGKARASIKGVKFAGNKKGEIYTTGGAKVTEK